MISKKRALDILVSVPKDSIIEFIILGVVTVAQSPKLKKYPEYDKILFHTHKHLVVRQREGVDQYQAIVAFGQV